jgi:broad specificity phosphatase PhoE
MTTNARATPPPPSLSSLSAEAPRWHRRTGSGTNEGGGTHQEDVGTLQYPTSHEGPGYQVEVPTVTTRKYAVIMVGLPARGKTFLAQKISRFFAWLGHDSAVFNVQRMWRDVLGVACIKNSPANGEMTVETSTMSSPYASNVSPDGTDDATASNNSDAARQFIDADTFFQAFTANHDKTDSYERAINHCATKVRAFFQRGGLVAFINDDFVTKASRDLVEASLEGVADSVLYIEVERDDHSNARFEGLKVSSSAEYGNKAGSAEAMSDFTKRVALLKSMYEHVKDDKSFIRVRNSNHIYLHDVRGYLPSRMTSFLMHLSPQNKAFCPIYFSRHGQSEYNLDDRLGGNPKLTEKGKNDAIALRNFVATLKAEQDEAMRLQNDECHRLQNLHPVCMSASGTGGSIGVSPTTSFAHSSIAASSPSHSQHPKPMQIWTSQLTRTIETARPAEEELGIQCLRWRNLNEIHAGVCEHMTYAEVRQRYPLIHDFRKKNKYAFRYPEGESYQDLVTRLEPVIMELENADRVVLVVAHQAVLRALLAYFGGNNAEHSVHVEVPHRTVWRCSYDGQGIPTLEEMKLPAYDPAVEPSTEPLPLNFVPTNDKHPPAASPTDADPYSTPKMP